MNFKKLTVKTVSVFTILIVSVLFFQNCKTAAPTVKIQNESLEKQFNDSANKWQSLKTDHKNSYSFAITNSSVFGYHSKTVMVVKNGVVTERKFYANDREDKDYPMIKEIYTEKGAEVGTNENGQKPITIDKIYSNCAEFSLTKDEKIHEITFKTDRNGIYSTCGTYEKGCMDDCYIGTTISDFQWLDK